MSKKILAPQTLYVLEDEIENDSIETPWTNETDVESYIIDIEEDSVRVALYTFSGFATVRRSVTIIKDK